MATVKVAVTIEQQLLEALDREVAAGSYASRSEAVRVAVESLLERRCAGLLAALAALDPAEEKALAEEWLEGEPW